MPNNITIDDLLQGNYVSDCRNKLIAKIFKEIAWIERYGTGIRRIRDHFNEYGSPEPLFENFQHGFRVTVYSLNTVIDDADVKVTAKVTANQQSILDEFSKNQFSTAEELSIKIGISTRKVKENIAKLKAMGIIERVGADKGGFWRVIKGNDKN